MASRTDGLTERQLKQQQGVHDLCEFMVKRFDGDRASAVATLTEVLAEYIKLAPPLKVNSVFNNAARAVLGFTACKNVFLGTNAMGRAFMLKQGEKHAHKE